MTRACVAVAAVLVTGALGATGCTSFSSYQTARMLAPRQLSVGGAVAVATHYRGVATPEVPPGVQGRAVLVEGLARFGVTDRLEAGLKLGYAHSFGDFELSLEQAFVDAKLSLLPDQLAVALPVGGTLIDGEAFDLQTQPGLIWTATLGRRLELDSAFKLVMVKTRGESSLGSLGAAAVVGVRIRSDHHRFELHPEVGVHVADLDEDSVAFGDSLILGIGLGVFFTP